MTRSFRRTLNAGAAAWKTVVRGLALLAVLLASMNKAGYAQGGPSEYAVKAAFLYNFAKFVQWPASAFSGPSAPIVVAILGNDPFGAAIDETMSGKSIDGHPIVVKRIGATQLDEKMHILFVPSESMHRASAVAELRSRPILIVGEADGFIRKCGDINFLFEHNKLAFEINARAAKGAGLNISSKLLQLAKQVE